MISNNDVYIHGESFSQLGRSNSLSEDSAGTGDELIHVARPKRGSTKKKITSPPSTSNLSESDLSALLQGTCWNKCFGAQVDSMFGPNIRWVLL